MAKGAGSTRKTFPHKQKESKIHVEDGVPKEHVEFIKDRLKKLNDEFGFYPDVNIKNTFKVSESAAGEYHDGDGYINVGLYKLGDFGYVIDHEYGHIFDIKNSKDLKPYKQLVKLNPNNKKFMDKLNEAKAYNKKLSEDKKWVKLKGIYDKLRKEPELKSSYAIKGGFKEFAAEMFALGRKVIGNSNFKWRKEYKDAYDLIIQFPRKNKK